ncbi:MAG: lysophospholipid acyltransferase family protein [Acidobacteriota bacterium]
MKNAPFRHRLEMIGYRAVQAFLKRLSPEGVRRFGRRLGGWAYRLVPSLRRRSLDNLALVMGERSLAERRQIARGSLRHLAAALCEALAIERRVLPQLDRWVDLAGLSHLDEAVGADPSRGVFLMTGHFGPWEIAAHALSKRFGGIDFVARPPDNPYLAAEILRLRERFGSRVIAKKGAAFGILRSIRTGRNVGILIDQRVRPSAGMLLPFFGRPAWTSPILAQLSIRTGAPVVPLFCQPLPGGRYELRFEPAIHPPAAAARGEEAYAALTLRYLAVLEDEIRKTPELWLWAHRRWKT